MNNSRRKRLTELAERMEILKSDIESIMDDEQEAFDNLPESLQAGEKGEAMEAAIAALAEVMDCIDSAASSLEEACS